MVGVLERASRIWCRKAAMAFLHVYFNGVIGYSALKRIMRLDDRGFKKVCANLVKKGLMTVHLDDSEIWCVCNVKEYNISVCMRCEHMSLKKVVIKGKKARYCVCGNKGPECKYASILAAFGKAKNVAKMFPVHDVSAFAIDARKPSDELERWNTRQFVKHMCDRYYKKYCERPEFGLDKMTNAVAEMRTLVKAVIGEENVNINMKRCMDKIIDRTKSKVFLLKNLSDLESVRRVLDTGGRRKKIEENVGECKKYGILCSYCGDAGCLLEDDGILCTEKIREAMRKKYVSEI